MANNWAVVIDGKGTLTDEAGVLRVAADLLDQAEMAIFEGNNDLANELASKAAQHATNILGAARAEDTSSDLTAWARVTMRFAFSVQDKIRIAQQAAA